MGMYPQQTMFQLTVILHHPGTTNMWLIYEQRGQKLSLNHVVYYNTYHYCLYNEYYILLHHTMLVMPSTFQSVTPVKGCKLCIWACSPQHSLDCLTELTKSSGTLKVY